MAPTGESGRGDDRPYHHGDLRRTVLDSAIEALSEGGPAALSVRDLARRAGVTHTSVTHHFGDKAGLFAAVAAEGYALLGRELHAVHDARGSFLDVGVAYVRFAVRHPAHFGVMFRPDLYDRHDPDVVAARAVTARLLYGSAGEIASAPDTLTTGIAAWSLVHGLATLWLDGNLPAELGDDPEEITRAVAAHLGGGRPRRQRAR